MPKTILGPTVLRQTMSGEWYLMNKREGGWASHAYGPYTSLDEVRETWEKNTLSQEAVPSGIRPPWGK